jgi:hypothetical protein
VLRAAEGHQHAVVGARERDFSLARDEHRHVALGLVQDDTDVTARHAATEQGPPPVHE